MSLKRFLACVLALVFLVTAMPLHAIAASTPPVIVDGNTSGGNTGSGGSTPTGTTFTFDYNENDLTATVIGFDSADANVTIPGITEHNGNQYAVVGVAAGAFASCTALETVVFPEGFLKIASGAFDNVTSLSKAYIPESVSEIASDAFTGCSANFAVYGKAGSVANDFATAANFIFTPFSRVQLSLYKTEYDLNEEFSFAGSYLHYYPLENGNFDAYDEIDLEEEMVSGFDSSCLGSQVVTVSYNGFRVQSQVTVKVLSLTDEFVDSIEIIAFPDKTSYFVGEHALDLTGGTFKVTYTDGTVISDVPLENATVGSFDTSTPGTVDVTFTFGDKSDTLQFEVRANSVKNISVHAYPAELTYCFCDTALDLSGGVLYVEFEKEGTYDYVDFSASGVTFSGFNPSISGTQEIVVSYQGKVTKFNITVNEKCLQSIEIENYPNKMTYFVNQPLDLTGGTILAHYCNSSSQHVSMGSSDVVITGFESDAVATIAPTVTYQDQSVYFTHVIEIVEPPVTGITVSKIPDATTIVEGMALSLTGGEITVTFEYGDPEVLPMDMEGVTVSVLDTSILGTHSVTVSYGGKSAQFDVLVVAKSITEISVQTKPQLRYEYGEGLNLSGGILRVSYNNGTFEPILLTSSDVITTGYNSAKSGSQTVTVTYRGLVTSFTVLVGNPPLVDLTGDGKIGTADAVYLLYHTFLPSQYPVSQNCDFNGDGVVSDRDAVYLILNDGDDSNDNEASGPFVPGSGSGAPSVGPFPISQVIQEERSAGGSSVTPVASVAPSISIQVSTDQIQIGQTATVSIAISNCPSLTSAMIQLDFGPALQLISADWTMNALIHDYSANNKAGVVALKDAGTLSSGIFQLVVKATGETASTQNIGATVTLHSPANESLGVLTASKSVSLVNSTPGGSGGSSAVLVGDADGDGEVSDWDGVLLARYLAGWNVSVDLNSMDIDGDGEITDWDGVILDRRLAGWNV